MRLPGTEKPPEKCQMSHESQRGRAAREEARSRNQEGASRKAGAGHQRDEGITRLLGLSALSSITSEKRRGDGLEIEMIISGQWCNQSCLYNKTSIKSSP